jgi:PIN domain nuclease of toxin-antitoxin system
VILLDTNVVLWIVSGDVRLGREAQEIVERASSAREVAVSAISFWEIGLLLSKRRIDLAMPLADFAAAIAQERSFRVIPVDAAVAVEAGSLPPGIHGDPGDRILIATARALGCPLVTADRQILSYASKGQVAVIDARR